jgi:hypothetical protein
MSHWSHAMRLTHKEETPLTRICVRTRAWTSSYWLNSVLFVTRLTLWCISLGTCGVYYIMWCSHSTHKLYNSQYYKLSGLGSVVSIATGYALDSPRIVSPWGARFSAPVQTGPGAHPASCTMGTGSFLGVKSGWGMTLTPHPRLVPWSWRSAAIPLLPPMGHMACTEPQCLYKGALYF